MMWEGCRGPSAGSHTMPWKNSLVLFTGVILLTILSVLLQPRRVVHAHPVDMYAQSQSVLITRKGLQIHWKITPGPLLAHSVWTAPDQNQHGSINAAEAQA